MGWVTLGHTVSCGYGIHYFWGNAWYVCRYIQDIKLMEIIPITEMRSMYIVGTGSITDNMIFCNILLCFKGGRTNVHQFLMGGGGQILAGGINIHSLEE